MRPRALTRGSLAVFYGVAGVFHLAMPAPFLTIMPGFVPAPELVVQLTGAAELAGAAALLQGWSPGLRRAGGWGLAAYALCVWPANINHMIMDLARADGGLGLVYHIPRMLAQPVLIWAAMWAGGVTDWPWRRR
ncbi:DoxX family protein [Croceibacterium ferulae]|uniref:DoxX family protein n=1 Tax=Croceibacterium ferulae TaxID=1854641 RepID=UPI00138FA17B|nr:DoxX family protein [Croceibacterium ferulae]